MRTLLNALKRNIPLPTLLALPRAPPRVLLVVVLVALVVVDLIVAGDLVVVTPIYITLLRVINCLST